MRVKSNNVLKWFMGYVQIDGACWNWTGALTVSGYGELGYNGQYYRAHRFSYMLLVGEIPPGLQLDHLCRNRTCVNPDHLEPVTAKENMQRGVRSSYTACPRGHPYAGENLYIAPDGSRNCKLCMRERSRLHYNKSKENKG